MSLLAIDPGRDTGWAFVDDAGRLLYCGLGEPPESKGHPTIIECPQVYRARHSKGDPNDLIRLAVQVGEYKRGAEMQGSRVELVLPRQWKGTVDADVLCRRVFSMLNPEEKRLVSIVLGPLGRKPLDTETLTSGRRHNVLDAIGLALWGVGPRLTAKFSRLASAT